MQQPDERKRLKIMRVAARMFAQQPYHEVRLDAIAAKAQLGKGTIYVYFASKEDLYTTLIAEGLDQLMTDLRAADRTTKGAWAAVESVVGAMLAFAERFPHVCTLMRTSLPQQEGRLMHKRSELAQTIASIIRRGVAAGELDDPHPDLTAEFLLSLIRVALLFPPPRLGKGALSRHILQVLGRGITKNRTRQ